MKKDTILFFLSFLSFFTGLLTATAQESEKDSITSNEYIKSFYNQLNIKLEISNEKKNYIIPFMGERATITPNVKYRYALGLNYKFISVRLGIRSPISEHDENDKGKSDHFRLKVKLLFSNWSHQFQYNYIKGYYIKNSDDYDDLINISKATDISNKIQFPDMKTNVYYGTSAYKFNKNYSVRATQSQTEIQIKSAGTLMPSIDYWYYKIFDTERYINQNGDIINREYFNKYKGFNTIANIGYYYTYVYKKNWYVFGFIAPGAGIDLYRVTRQTPDGRNINNYSSFVLSMQTGAAIGYNSKSYYFGADFNIRQTSESYGQDDLKFNTSNTNFHIFAGYRFKAPKPVTKSVDFIENKVPLLKDIDTKKH